MPPPPLFILRPPPYFYTKLIIRFTHSEFTSSAYGVVNCCCYFATVPPTVSPLEEEVTVTLTETDVNRPPNITLGFTITGANPEVEIENIVWTYTLHNLNGSTLNTAELASSGSKYNLSVDYRTLTIFNVTYFDAGSIMLSASNGAIVHFN